MERDNESRRTEPDEPARLLREMLRRKEKDPMHLDILYDPRYEARVSLGHLLGVLRGNKASSGTGLIPVHAFEPETQETFDVTPTNALIMSAGPHVALRALQGTRSEACEYQCLRFSDVFSKAHQCRHSTRISMQIDSWETPARMYPSSKTWVRRAGCKIARYAWYRVKTCP